MEQFGGLSLGSRLKRLSDFLFAEVEAIYKELSVPFSPTYFPVLRLLQKEGGKSVVELAEALRLSHPAVSKQIARMEKERYVERTLDVQDQRRSVVRLSEYGEQVLNEAEPCLQQIKREVDRLSSQCDGDFLSSFEQFERIAFARGVKQAVVEAMGKGVEELKIITWDAQFKSRFHDLNMDWLQRFFPTQIEDKDILVLTHPESEVLGRGGQLWFAQKGNQIVGTCALVPRKNGEVEMIKLAVDSDHQGEGIGKQLTLKVIEESRRMKVERLSLETSSRLKPALALYSRLGFRQEEPADGYSIARSDTYMVLEFPSVNVAGEGK